MSFPGALFFVDVREPTHEEMAQLAGWPDLTLPPEWLAWADEPHRVLAAFEGGRVVGAVNLAVVGQGEGWIEGVRAKPDEVEAVADRLVAAAVEVLHGYGAVVVRTASPRGARAGWMDRAGFAEKAQFTVRLAPPGPPPEAGAVRPATPREAGQVAGRLGGRLREQAAGLVPLGWRWRSFRTEMAAAAAREGRLLVDGKGGAALVLRRGGDRLLAALAAESPEGLVGAVRAELVEGGRLACFLPASSPEAAALEGWPAHPWCPEGVVVYELTGGHG